MTDLRLLPAVCATRANYHAYGHIALVDVHTQRIMNCRSPPPAQGIPRSICLTTTRSARLR